MDAQDVAHFLYKGEGLNKTAIGEYIRDHGIDGVSMKYSHIRYNNNN